MIRSLSGRDSIVAPVGAPESGERAGLGVARPKGLGGPREDPFGTVFAHYPTKLVLGPH